MTRILRSTPPGPKQPPPARETRVLRAKDWQGKQAIAHAMHEARTEAAAILKQAQQDAAALRAQAEEEGLAAATALLVKAQQDARAEIQGAKEELAPLAVRIAEKILGEQLRLHPETITFIVRECLKNCVGVRRITLRVHPADCPQVEHALDALRQHTEAEVLRLHGDPLVERGGCVLETDRGQIDGQLSTQLNAIMAVLQR